MLKISRASVAAQLVQPVNTVEEFVARCIALGTILGDLQVPPVLGPDNKQMKSLGSLQSYLRDRLGDNAAAAVDAVQKLRAITALRDVQAHPSGSTLARFDQTRASLGLPRFGSDWAVSWDLVGGHAALALNTVREGLVGLADEADQAGDG